MQYGGDYLKTVEDLTGQRFGRLTVISRDEDYIYHNKQRYARWKCKCDCGKITIVRADKLKIGTTQSCGCLQKERSSEKGKKQKKYNKYDLSGNYGIGNIYTKNPNQSSVFYFDLDDYDKIKNYYWKYDSDGYIQAFEGRKSIFLHRLVMNCPKNLEVDHIEHLLYDNRKEKLRIVNRSQNCSNKKPKNIWGVSGIRKTESGKYTARIKKDGVSHHLGTFNSLEEAICARKEAEKKYFSDYSFFNNLIGDN